MNLVLSYGILITVRNLEGVTYSKPYIYCAVSLKFRYIFHGLSFLLFHFSPWLTTTLSLLLQSPIIKIYLAS